MQYAIRVLSVGRQGAVRVWSPQYAKTARRRLVSTSNQPKHSPENATTDSTGTTTTEAETKSKITWTRGYLGAHSDTKPPDATFLAVASIVIGAGFYAWFIEPPERRE